LALLGERDDLVVGAAELEPPSIRGGRRASTARPVSPWRSNAAIVVVNAL
jgi:hypothetical protein